MLLVVVKANSQATLSLNSDLPDSMKIEWNASLVSSIIQEYASKHNIEIVNTRGICQVRERRREREREGKNMGRRRCDVCLKELSMDYAHVSKLITIVTYRSSRLTTMVFRVIPTIKLHITEHCK
jgi:hypothetical protein